MKQEWNALPTPTRMDAELFIHLRLETAGAAPLLAAADVAQAAETGLRARVRQHRCRVLAVCGGADHLHAVLQFPASLSLRHLVQVAREASAQAVARALALAGVGGVSPDGVWGGAYQLDTLSRADVADVAAYVARHPDVAGRPALERADVEGEVGQRPSWAYAVREERGRYRPAPDPPRP